MQLVVFDLDTALCQTSAMDGLAMASAIKDVADCQIEPEKVKSLHDPKSIWYRATDRVATVSDLAELRDRFSFHLRRQFLIRPSIISANYSLVEHINCLQNQRDTIVGLVSSTSSSVLLLKSRAIGLVNDTLPIATGDDSDTLDGILNTLKTRVKRSYGFNFGEASVIASEDWVKASKTARMNHMLPDEYLSERAVSVRSNLFTRTVKQFSKTN